MEVGGVEAGAEGEDQAGDVGVLLEEGALDLPRDGRVDGVGEMGKLQSYRIGYPGGGLGGDQLSPRGPTGPRCMAAMRA